MTCLLNALFLIPPSLPGRARFLPPPFELEYGCMDGDQWRQGTILEAPGNWKKKWRDDTDLRREMWKMKLKRKRRSREIERRGRGEKDKVEKEEDNPNARKRKIGVGALPSLSSLPLRNNE
jgi:hypothetical protein